MVDILMKIIAVCAILGGIDRMLGNRFGLGKAFEQGFMMLGPVGLSMAGMICLAPALASALSGIITPFYRLLGQDPAMFGSFLAIDMGGYQMAKALAQDEIIGRFAGILVASTFGCTLSFTIPTGMGILSAEHRDDFAWGIMYGLITLPVAMLLGAVLCGIPFLSALWLCVPLAILSGVLALLIAKWPEKAGKAFKGLAWLLKLMATAGLTIGAFQMISGITLISAITPLDEAMRIVSTICVTLLGSLPMAELLQRLQKKPFTFLGEKLGIGAGGMMDMLLFYLNATPGLTAMDDLNARGRRACAAFSVCAASALTAHLAFTMDCEPSVALMLMFIKLLGGALGAALALVLTKKQA